MANMGCGRGGFFYGFMVVELKVAVIVVEGGGVFIMGHMWVHDGYGGGGGGGVVVVMVVAWPWVSVLSFGDKFGFQLWVLSFGDKNQFGY